MKGTLIAGFGAIGKTTLSKKYENVIDLESSSYKYIIDEELQKLNEEERKGLKNRQLNPAFPKNYYNDIIFNLSRYDIVLISMHKEIIELLEQNNIDYFVVYPEENMIEEIIERAKRRGNNQEFITGIKDAYHRLFPKNSKNVIRIKQGQYLEEILIKNGLL